jgi:hypothetical protein
MAITKATAFRFTDDDLAILDAIQRYTGVRTRTEAVRMAIHHYVRIEGVKTDAPKATKRRGAR